MTLIKLSLIDYIIIIIYLIGTLCLGLFYSGNRKKEKAQSYLLAGRRLSLPAFTATLVSTWYGGVLGIGEFTYIYGLLNWVTQALPYYLFAVIFAFVFAPKIQKTKLFTIPDQLYNNYGKASGILGSIFVFILVSPAAHLLMVILLLSALFGISAITAFFIAVIFSALYVLFGGFRSVVKTDILQFILMFFGFFILVIFLFSKYGGMSFLQENLPTSHLTITGDQEISYIFVWFFIALWTFVDPGFYQRCYAAKSPDTAKYGILAAVLFWVIFDLLTTLSGLYARAVFSDINPVMAFPKLGVTVLPIVFQGFFFVGLLATIMSSLDSTFFLAAVTFGRDVVWRLGKKGDIKKYTQIGLGFSVAVSAVIIYFIPSVVKIWYTLGTLFIPALLIPVGTNFICKWKMTPGMTFFSMLFSFLITLIWFLTGIWQGSLSSPMYILSIQPFFIGLFISVSFYLVGLLSHFYYKKGC